MAATRFVGCVAALLVLAASACGGSPKPQPTATPFITPSASVGANETPAPTATPTAAGPTPTATQIALPSTVAGKPVIQLTPGPPVEFPDDLVLYVAISSCANCGFGEGEAWRIYRGRDGQLVADRVEPEGWAWTREISPDGSTIVAGVCTGYCGGEADPSGDAAMRIVISHDGGITWQSAGPQTFARTLFWFNGWYGDQAVATAVKYMDTKDEVERVDSYLLPSFTRLEPPAGLPPSSLTDFQFPYPRVSPGGELVWSMRRSSGPDLVFDEEGRPTSFAGLAAVVPGADWFGDHYGTPAAMLRPYGVRLDGQAFRVMVDHNGTPLAGFAADTQVPRAIGVSEARFVAAAVLPLLPGEETIGGNENFRAVLVDAATGVMHPINGVPRDASPLPGNFTWPILAITGKFWRVDAGDSCLNVRQEPSVASATLGCFASGVLLREREAEAAAGWEAVATPDGRPGFAASQYLR